ncbi:MAG: hypothetical protein PHV33_09260 [Elusimicrobiales bacterium]|nr:hypothetical protein [Elusimicrobiales bacterium]
MKKLLLLPLLLLTAAAPGGKEKAAVKTTEKIADFATYTAPEGWAAEEKIGQGDPQARLEKGLHVITVRLAGGPGSRYKSPAEFQGGFEARSLGGKPAEKARTVIVSGARVMVYRRKVPVALPPPDESGPATLTSEEFCVLPAGRRFFVLSYSYGDTTPDPAYDGEKAWAEFLKSFRAKKR